ncbi:MAG: discoidin domain-containing protein [Anaerolineales bacterium]
MISKHKLPLLTILILLIFTSLACQLPETLASTPTSLPITSEISPTSLVTGIPVLPTTTHHPTAQATSPPAVAPHRIATHRIYGIAEFYDRATSASFIPRGVNYFMLVPVLGHYEDRVLGVGIYDHKRAQADLSALSAAGYNTVRILLDGCTSGSGCIGMENGQGLNPAYLDNMVDLMMLAKTTNLLVLFASQELPELGGYAAMANQAANASFAPGRNAEYLTTDGIRAAQQYWSDLISGLAARQAPFEVILAWELVDEQYYIFDQPPFSLDSGRVTPANGKTYTMPSLSQKNAMALDGMRYYIDQLRQTILAYDPTTLVTMGFFAPNTPNEWREDDNRYVETAALLDESSLDFFDLHASPDSGSSMDELAQNFGLGEHVTKPVIMGAVGASTWSYPQVTDGAIATQDWIAASCGYGFTGWLYSGYYPVPAGLPEATWGFVDDRDLILKALSPQNQPDACAVTVLPGRNLALGKGVEVSAALPDQTPQMAVDGDPNTQWSAGAYPTQWIEIDLGARYQVGAIRLTVGQWPAGITMHQLWAGASPDAMQLVYEFSGREYDFDVLNYVPAMPLENIRYVRVVTTESPSWVSWREIEVLAPLPSIATVTPESTHAP